MVPSPYKADGSFNDQIIDTAFFDEKPNPLTDFNGKELTDILVGLGVFGNSSNRATSYCRPFALIS